MESVDENGSSHKFWFVCCDCEPLPITLARAKLWPASPTNPRFAFSFALLDWAEALMLECQVALKDFCSAHKFRNPFSILKSREFYSSLINSFEEYRFMRHQLRHLNFYDESLDVGNICPACPQKNGRIILAMDALFGLPRKKSAGSSYRDPLHGDLLCLDQGAVDQYVCDYPKQKSLNVECNDFLAGNMIRSATRYKCLDETAVFGYCCRHEFPGKFINLKHGEKLSYAVWMLEQIIGSHSNSNQIFVMYDIACTLSQHLKTRKRADILDRVDLTLPTFHCYGHKVSCQVVYGPRRCVGIGLSDGETMERLWSYLRRFSRMTKEMRPSHRTDILTSALLFYGMKTKKKLSSLLLARYHRAVKAKVIAEELLQHYSNFTHEDIDKWLEDEVTSCSVDCHRARPAEWQTKYFHMLHLYYSLKNQLASGRKDISTYGQITWLEIQLNEWEQKHSLTRWLPSDTEYKQLEHSLLLDKREQMLLELWKGSQRRLFLLKLKKKYADGQKIAKKVSMQISKEIKSLKSTVEDYNACLDEHSKDVISFDEALDPTTLECRLQSLGVWCQGTMPEKREIMDSYLLLCRSKEELSMLQGDIQNVICFYEQRKASLMKAIDTANSTNSPYHRGISSLLHRLLQDTSSLLQEAKNCLSCMVEENNDDLCFSDSDYDSCDDDDNEYC